MPLPRSALARLGPLLGLPALGLIWAAATFHAAPQIAARIAADAEAVVRTTEAGAPEPWLRIAVAGRDLVARGEAPGPEARAAALARLATLDGPRRIVSALGLIETAAPFTWRATRLAPDRIALAGDRPAEIGRAALNARIAADLATGTVIADTARAARGAPPDFSSAAAFAAAGLAHLAPGGRATLTDTVVAFDGAATDVAGYAALRTALADPPPGYTIGRSPIRPAEAGDFHAAIARTAGGLVLSGYVVSEEARAALTRRAGEIADGGAVEDRMRTAGGLAAGIDPDALAAFLVRAAGLMQAGTAAFDGARVAITGDAVDAQAIAEIEALMREGRPAGVGAGPVRLGTRPLAPYRVAIRREGDTVALSGHLPDAETRERLAALVRPRFFRERILDRTRTADGAPPDLLAVLGLALPALANLAGGEIAVAGRSLTLTGESLYPEAAARIAQTLPPALPPGWNARIGVLPRGSGPGTAPERCRADAATLVGTTSLRFAPGSTALQPIFYPLLDRLAALAKACPALRVAVAGHGDPAKPAAKPAETGTVAAAQGAKPDAARVEPAADRPAEAKGAGRPAPAQPPPKPQAGKPQGKSDAPKPELAKPDPAPEAAEPDIARARALAVAEYLYQAGARPEQVRVADLPGPALAFALLP